MDQFFLGAVGLMAIITMLTVIIAQRRAQRRRAMLRQVALRLGFTFDPQGNQGQPVGREGFSLFKRGRAQKIQNVLRGQIDQGEGMVFDYTYVTGSGKHRSSHRQTVALCRLPGEPLPSFTLGPEYFIIHKIAEWFGHTDVDFPSHPTFSKMYTLQGEDEAAVRQLFRTDVLAFFESHGGWCLEGSGDRLLVYGPGRLIAPEAMSRFLEDVRQMRSLFAGREFGGPQT